MAREYRVPFGHPLHATILVEHQLDVGEARDDGHAYGDEDFKDAAIEEGYIVEILEEGVVVDAIASEDSEADVPDWVTRV